MRYNALSFGHPLTHGLSELGQYHFGLPFTEGFSGVFLNHNFGLVIIIPWLLLTLLWIRKSDFDRISVILRKAGFQYPLALIAGSLCFLLILCFYNGWFGGWSYSARIASGAIPPAIFIAGPLLKRISQPLKPVMNNLVQQVFRTSAFILFTISAFWSILVNLIGVYSYDSSWNSEFDRGIDTGKWVWKLENNIFLWHIRRGIVYYPDVNEPLGTGMIPVWPDSEGEQTWNEPEMWGDTRVRWSTLRSTEYRPPSPEKTLVIDFFVGHQDLETEPFGIVISDGIITRTVIAENIGTYTVEFPPSEVKYRITYEVERSFTAYGDPRILGIAVFRPGGAAPTP